MSAGVCIEEVSSLGAGKVGLGWTGSEIQHRKTPTPRAIGRVRAGTRDGSSLKLWLLGCS